MESSNHDPGQSHDQEKVNNHSSSEHERHGGAKKFKGDDGSQRTAPPSGQTVPLHTGLVHQLNETSHHGPIAPKKPWRIGTSINAQLAARNAPASSDDGVDEDEHMEDSSLENSKGTWEVQRTRDRFFSVLAKSEFITGSSIEKQKQDLLHLLLHRKVNVTEGPIKVGKYFKISVETEEELKTLLEETALVMDDNGSEVEVPYFERVSDQRRISAQERTVVIHGLHHLVEEIRIKSSLTKFGDIEAIKLDPNSSGTPKVSARVRFVSTEAIKLMQEAKIQYVFIGKDMARIAFIGTERIEWTRDHTAKLACLPPGTAPADLKQLLEPETGATFIDVPYAFQRGNRARQGDAFVYFATQEDMKRATTKSVKLGKHEVNWIGLDEKRCYQCGEAGHIKRDCEKFKKKVEMWEHKRMVRDLQRGIIPGKSFAQAAGRDTNIPSHILGSKVVRASTHTIHQERTTNKEENKGDSTEMMFLKEMFQEMKESNRRMQEEIQRMREEQQRIMEQNSAMLAVILDMTAKAPGAVSPDLIAKIGLSPETQRNVMKNNKGKNKAGNIPSSNESLAGIMMVVSSKGLATYKPIPIPTPPNGKDNNNTNPNE
ncbi:MAG: hypothetical protein BYD32DRAFT_434083 [Podila humilis]|nr:MAG: hypothetical protein BYD32DRAFT_434083 [Podila humilis]